MSYSKLIHEYLDGGIDSTQEALLFDMLSKDSELRADFNKQMKLHLIAQQDMNHISPPAEATNELFGRLGFTVPDYLETPAPSIAAKVTGYIKKYGVMAMLLLLTSALSVVMTSNYDNWFGDGQTIAQSELNSQQNNIPVVSSFENDDENANANNHNNNTTDQTLADANNNNNQFNSNNSRYYSNASNQQITNRNNNSNTNSNSDALAVNAEDNELESNKSIFDAIASIFTSEAEYTDGSDIASISEEYGSRNGSGAASSLAATPFVSTIILPAFGGDENSKFEFGVKYTSDASSNDYSHLALNGQFYDNMIVSGMYHINEYHSVGAEVGMERFAQSFVTNYYGELTEQKQYPRRFIAGLTYRFTYTNLMGTEFVSPYAELFAGGSSLGPISKAGLGISLTPLNNISMNLGYEYGVLYYSVDSKTYNSDKQGFIYRISYNF